jgi:hypothetical protein
MDWGKEETEESYLHDWRMSFRSGWKIPLVKGGIRARRRRPRIGKAEGCNGHDCCTFHDAASLGIRCKDGFMLHTTIDLPLRFHMGFGNID